ncbi:MFS transporter [Stenotrophomonas sp. W1S232]|uniref:MFS transporter n=1 Tax=Stenotrophomonas koreensis TaxID=266128 RepID=A0A7W3UXN5_9GAMM|nr:MFS transporter [Stenotrophomonas koreensis]MBB1115724.1 MFS transporter [Stenotrophomonas koreensis]
MNARKPSPARPGSTGFTGNDSALLGIVLAVVTFWLFAQTTMNIGPLMATDVGMPMPVMNIAISISALFSGMFIVVLGGLGDRFGRVRIVLLGNLLNIVGSLLIAFAVDAAATPMILLGRVLQGLAAGSIMPSTMALLKVYWDGKQRQRAVSMWSIGSWGGSGLTAIFGGFMASTMLGWRSIFILCALVSVASIALMRQIPESAPLAGRGGRTDWTGIVSMAVGLAALLIVVTQGSSLGWGNLLTWGLLALFLLAFGVFVNTELHSSNPLVDFKLFKNSVFTGATISNFLINGTAGALTVSLWVLQGAAGMSAATAGYLTVGYAVFIIAFIRVGEKLLQRFGPRKPMLWGTLIVLLSIGLLMATHTLQWQYTVLAVVAYSLFGLGLAFYATPSTDAALTNLPDDQAGSGSGIYKMASSLGAAFGVAASAAIFTALSESGLQVIGTVIEFTGRQDNVAVREAGMVGLAFNALMAIAALVSISIFIPRQGKRG